MKAFKNENGEMVKTCSRCKRTLPVSEFSHKSKEPDGFESYCKDCVAKKSREYYYRTKNQGAKHPYANSMTRTVLDLLPEKFTKAQYYDAVEAAGMAHSSGVSLFSKLTRQGKICHHDGKLYRKITPSTQTEPEKEPENVTINDVVKQMSEFSEKPAILRIEKPLKLMPEHVGKSLSDYDAIELMAELYRRGYEWSNMTVTVVQAVPFDNVKSYVAEHKAIQ